MYCTLPRSWHYLMLVSIPRDRQRKQCAENKHPPSTDNASRGTQSSETGPQGSDTGALPLRLSDCRPKKPTTRNHEVQPATQKMGRRVAAQDTSLFCLQEFVLFFTFSSVKERVKGRSPILLNFPSPRPG